MGEYIIKAAPDKPYYLIWSTYVDCPIYVFSTREELLEHLNEVSAPNPGRFMSPEARVARADMHGSSAILPAVYRWDDGYLLFHNDAPPHVPGFYWMLPRARLADYCTLLIRHPDASAELTHHLFELFLDEDV